MYHPRLVVAEDHPSTAALLCDLLKPEFDVVSVVSDGEALVAAAARLSPDAIVTDVSMPGLDGISAATRILVRDHDARIVIVSIHADQAVVDRAMTSGAMGYVSKMTAGDELAPAVRAALRGEHYVSQGLDCPPV